MSIPPENSWKLLVSGGTDKNQGEGRVSIFPLEPTFPLRSAPKEMLYATRDLEGRFKIPDGTDILHNK